MKKSSKILLIVVIVVVLVMAIIIGLAINKKREEPQTPVETENKTQESEEIANQEEEKYVQQLEDGTKINVSGDLNSTKKYKDLEISNIQFTEKGGITVLLADVKNIGTAKHEIEIIKIAVLGENGEVITELNPIIGEINVGETIKMNANITADVVNAKDIRIEAGE